MKNFIKAAFFVVFVLCVTSCRQSNSTKPVPVAGPNIQQYVTVTRIPQSDTVIFVFSKKDTWSIYTLDSVNGKAKATADIITNDSVVLLRVKDANARYYFKVVNSKNESATLTETVLPIKGQPNFRDLGGLITTDGYSIKWGRLFRSGALNKLTPADVAYMKSAGIQIDIDFRRPEEYQQAQDRLPEGVKLVNLPIKTPPDDNSTAKWLSTKDALALDTMFIPLYRSLVTDPLCQSQYAHFLNRLATTDSATVYHCSAGKDRTGFATVLLLSALGVDRHTVVSNYLETNQYISAEYSSYVAVINKQYGDKRGGLLSRSLLVNYEYIKTSLDIIDKMPGGMDGYLKDVLKVDAEALKLKYLDNYKKK